MFIDMLGQPDLHKYDLSSVEAGKRLKKIMIYYFVHLRHLSLCVLGLMGGSQCPPEIVRKLKTDMNFKEMMVSSYMSCIKLIRVELLQHIKHVLLNS